MKNFIIFFNGHEGSTAIISHLKKLEQFINILWYEPFDNCHLKKSLKGDDLTNLFKAVFTNDKKSASNIYNKYSDSKLELKTNRSVGFKMRWRSFNDVSSVLRDEKVVVFILIRKNILKSAVSRCKSNSMQFKLIKKEIEQNPKTVLNLKLLKEKLLLCEQILKDKEDQVNRCKQMNVEVHKIYYEDYCNDKVKFFTDVLGKLEINLTDEQLEQFAFSTNYFKKVHDDDIRKFVVNYDEVLKFVKDNNLESLL